jgi:hypothetical protein
MGRVQAESALGNGPSAGEFAGIAALVIAVIGALPRILAILTKSKGDVRRSQVEMAAAEVTQFESVFQAQGKLLDASREEVKELREQLRAAEERIAYLERLLGPHAHKLEENR